ncbi:O-antigen ligase family protein [Rheinheimera sp. WS51]|uniref:O-antigen ligase family protein n=1 Tax=Rheinheimera sp. WS51 TaxID=3425886 RepID=UPI003D9239B4
MKFKISLVEVKSAQLFFILLFPLFFIYQAIMSLGYIPPFLGAYFGLVSLIILPFVLVNYFYVFFKKPISWLEKVFLIYVAYSVFITLFNFSVTNLNEYDYDMLYWSISSVIFIFICFFIGKNVEVTNAFYAVCLLLFFLSVLLVLLNVGERGIFYLKSDSVNDSLTVTYQGFARSLLMMSLYCVAFCNNRIYKLGLFALATVALFFNGARTEFIVFTVSFLSVYLLSQRSFKLLFLMVFSTMFLMYFGEQIYEMLPDNRMKSIFNIFSTTSANSRSEYFNSALTTISNSPLFGDYGSYLNEYGQGGFSHNVFSAWVNLGLLGFVLYLSIITSIIFMVFKDICVPISNKAFTFKAMLAISVITMLLFSKDYSYMLFGFMVGVFCNNKINKEVL